MATALGHCHSYWSGVSAWFRFADLGAGAGHGSHDEAVAQGAPRQLLWSNRLFMAFLS
ncbi:hypothetical protein [Sinorhizobium meliloti]|uniref:hypothetical protein n=1 Tax=Rhizobium meliloti TaxID=382 RepID=UPI0030A4B4A0